MENVVERIIAWGELDPLGIVFYPRYYEWMDDCGHRFFDALGLSLGVLREKNHLIFGLVETGFRYHSPGRYGDRIRAVTRILRLERKILVLETSILRVPADELLAVGFEERICLDCSDPSRLRAADIPPEILEKLQNSTRSQPGVHTTPGWR